MASAVRYRISVRGRLTERLGSAFHGMILGRPRDRRSWSARSAISPTCTASWTGCAAWAWS